LTRPIATCCGLIRKIGSAALERGIASGGDDQVHLLAGYIRSVSAINRWVGLTLSWLALAVVLVCFTVVVQRYFLHTTQLWMQDLYVWLSGAMFTGVAGFALLRNEHVRVDIFYGRWSVRGKAIADLIGVCVFLLPFVVVVALYTMPFVQRSWRIYEGSANVGGMPGLFILKSFILLFCALVGLQGIAWAFRSILVLAGREELLPEKLRYTRETAV
jgi:TRAP-type mannitol/chloroaromatic compound transport system permease small subunit